MTSKERTRRYRQRHEEGLRVVRVEISEDVVRALIAREYLDPQQRLLLTTVWEALEDASLLPQDLVGTNVGVYVGASMTDHGNGHTSTRHQTHSIADATDSDRFELASCSPSIQLKLRQVFIHLMLLGTRLLLFQ